MEKSRICKWDNAKGVLIFLVVLGHFIGSCEGQSDFMKAIYLFIHIFHMPLFVFITGLFSQHTIDSGDKLGYKFIGYMGLCFAQKYLMVLIELIFGQMEAFSISKSWGASWYLFAVAIWLLVTYGFRKVDRRWLFVFAILTAMFAGYDTAIAGKWCLSRILVFYPFFLMGSMWNVRCYSFREGRRIGRISRAAAAAVLIVCFFLLYKNLQWNDGMKKMVLGFYDYADFLEDITLGAWYRLLYYAVVILTGFCVMLLIPERPSPLTMIGQRSMQIYLYHYPIRDILDFAEWETLLAVIWPAHWKVLIFVFSVILTAVLAYPALDLPIRKYWDSLARLKEE